MRIKFNVPKGKFYVVKWYSSAPPGGYKGGPPMTGYRDNRIDIYWERHVQIEQIGSPKAFYATKNGKAHLKVDGGGYGAFFIKPSELSKTGAIQIRTNDSVISVIDTGNSQLLCSEILVSGATYDLTLLNLTKWGPLVGLYVQIAAYGEQSDKEYFRGERSINIEAGGLKVLQITPVMNEKVYFVVTGSFWYSASTYSIKISR